MEIMRQAWWEQGVILDRRTLVFIDRDATLRIGSGSIIGPYTILHLQNDPLNSDPDVCQLVIGQRTAINEFCNIRASGGSITIGDNCLLAQFVSIIASNHETSCGTPMRDQPWDESKRNVVIGNDVWIGANVVVLPGTSVGNGSILAAGAVVTQDIPESAIAAGVPARVIGKRGQSH